MLLCLKFYFDKTDRAYSFRQIMPFTVKENDPQHLPN